MRPQATVLSGRLSTPITQTAAYYCAFVALGFVPAAMGPALPVLAEHTHSSLAVISFLLSARSLGYLIGSFQGGRLYDRLPGHRVMAVSNRGRMGWLCLVS